LLTPSAQTNRLLAERGYPEIRHPVSAHDFLCGVDVRISMLQDLGVVPRDVDPEALREAETRAKYSGYIARQQGEVHRMRRFEERAIPDALDYDGVQGLRSEARERLERVRPGTVGQASRIAGVAPSDISILMVHLERERRRLAV
jgi:tRNA uridine 5-carboxymethylaminomethyl modification enzyme